MAAPVLHAWMNGEHVGTWSWTRTGTSVFRYADSWLRSPQVRPLSLSLPITLGEPEVRGPVVEAFFDNLLPDSDSIRQRLRQRYRAASTQAADLLAVLGRDCVGAIQLLPEGSEPAPPTRIDSVPLGEKAVARLLRSVTSTSAPDDPSEELRVSIAGAQEKTALLRIGLRWHRPVGATPTTHILKLPLGLVGNMRADMSTSVENEWLCSVILAGLGLPIARTEIARFEDQKALVVERFDRAWMAGGTALLRLPQEDLCQALGVPWHRKYESDGGPGMRQVLELLGGSNEAAADKKRFVLAQLAFWLLAATDGHAKNFSIHLLPGGAYQATPLYDVLSMWPITGDGPNQQHLRRARLAMAVRGKSAHYHLHELQPRHWRDLAERAGVPDAWPHMLHLVERVPIVLDGVQRQLPGDFPDRVWTPVRQGMLAQCARFREGSVVQGR